MSRKRRILITAAVLVVVIPLSALLAFVVWASSALPAMPEALAAMESDAAVTVTENDWITFSPNDVNPDTGLIFYPGARVDPRAYAVPARALAEAGYYVVIVPMPLNMAIFGSDRAADVIAANPQISSWALGGHSMGGAFAASFVDTHPGAVDGLVFWAAYPPDFNDLTDQPDLHVASIYGTLDGLATVDKVLAGKPLLPPSATFVPIEGGNHAQFGSYGDQSGDNPATISREEQQAQVVAATAALLEAIDAP